MAVSVLVRGQGDLRRAATQFREEARRLQLNVNDAVSEAAKGFKPVLQASAAEFMPKRGGYAVVLGKAMRVQTLKRAAGLRLRVSAQGKQELRDLDARDRGRLRAPNFGRFHQEEDGTWVPNKWHEQAVRPGVVTIPFDRWLKPRVESNLGDTLDEVRDRLERG